MGKKKKKRNRVMIAALTGVAAGLTISSILGTEKAKQILNAAEDSIERFAMKMDEGVTGKTNSELKGRPNKEAVPQP